MQTVSTVSLLFSGGAWAQNANGGIQSAKAQAAYADWRRLSQTEVNCVDQSLRGQRTNLWSLIQRGVDPSDPTVAKLRAACRTQARAPNTSVAAQSGLQAQATVVDSALNRAVTDKAAADKAAADKAAADKAAADRAAADEAAAKEAVAKAAEKAAAMQAAIDLAKAETERANAEAIKAQAQAEAERPRPEAETTSADAGLTYTAADARMSFIYGLISSPICFGLGGLVFLWARRRRSRAEAAADAPALDRASRRTQREFDRLVTAVLAEVKRREAKHSEPVASDRDDESVLH